MEADVDDPAEDWEQLDAEGEIGDQTSVNGAPAPAVVNQTDTMDTTIALGATDGPCQLPHAVSQPLPIRSRAPGSEHTSDDRGTPSPPHAHEGPITPRNEVGPWVFDGGAGQREGEPAPDNGMRSLDAATENINGQANGAEVNGLFSNNLHQRGDSSDGSIG